MWAIRTNALPSTATPADGVGGLVEQGEVQGVTNAIAAIKDQLAVGFVDWCGRHHAEADMAMWCICGCAFPPTRLLGLDLDSLTRKTARCTPVARPTFRVLSTYIFVGIQHEEKLLWLDAKTAVDIHQAHQILPVGQADRHEVAHVTAPRERQHPHHGLARKRMLGHGLPDGLAIRFISVQPWCRWNQSLAVGCNFSGIGLLTHHGLRPGNFSRPVAGPFDQLGFERHRSGDLTHFMIKEEMAP